MITHQSTDS